MRLVDLCRELYLDSAEELSGEEINDFESLVKEAASRGVTSALVECHRDRFELYHRHIEKHGFEIMSDVKFQPNGVCQFHVAGWAWTR